MVANRKVSGTASSIPGGIGWGLLAEFLITLAGAGIMAWMVSSEKMSQSTIGYGAMVLLVIASASGAWLAAGRIKRLRVQMCLLSGAVYYLSLLAITAMFFGGQYQGMGVTFMMIFLGASTGIIPGILKQRTAKYPSGKRRYR